MTTTKNTINPDELAHAWLALWNEDPSLARQLATGDFRMWLGATANADVLRWPAAAERFIAAYRARQSVRFTPRVVLGDDGGQRFAYTWDAELADGTVLTGADAYTLRDGRISENWSLTGEHQSVLQPGEPTAGPGATAAELERVCQTWFPMWNGQPELAAGLVTPGFRIWFGLAAADDDVTGPDGLADYVTRHRARCAGLAFARHRDLIIDTGRQRAAFTWTATLPGAPEPVGGLDVLQFAGGRIDRAWSWTGKHAFTF
jgi:SnoaL-like domain